VTTLYDNRPDRGELAGAYLNLVRSLAAKFANRGEPLEDLVQIGSVGLLKAIDRFDPSRDTKFTTYATPTILGEIKRYFRDNTWPVRVPRRLQELNVAINRASDRLTMDLGRSTTVRELAEKLGSREEDIIEAQELSKNVLTLDPKPTSLGDSEMERFEEHAYLESAMRVLNAREREIIRLRFFELYSQTEVAKQLGISQMLVSRLQARALKKLRPALIEA
jgi:RNA polymerase sigma-B factor